MVKLVFLIFVWGPVLMGFSLGWLVRHPEDWSGPFVIGPIGAVVTWLSYRWGLRKVKELTGDVRLVFLGGMIAGGDRKSTRLNSSHRT